MNKDINVRVNSRYTISKQQHLCFWELIDRATGEVITGKYMDLFELAIASGE